MFKLSILICSLESRKDYLERLLSCLEKIKTDDIEVIINVDKCEKSVGQKRNELIARANGEYIAFIDDDDLVPEYYVEEILKAIKESPDCVGFKLAYSEDGVEKGTAIHSIGVTEWATTTGDNGETIYMRTINHLNPVKREIASETVFEDISHGEDHAWSKLLAVKLKSSVFIDKIMYNYLYRRNK
jgi:glycosyltransferase involved in cell wall biosynthesis